MVKALGVIAVIWFLITVIISARLEAQRKRKDDDRF